MRWSAMTCGLLLLSSGVMAFGEGIAGPRPASLRGHGSVLSGPTSVSALVSPPLLAGGVVEAIQHRAEAIGDRVKTSLSQGRLSPLIIVLLYLGGILSAFSPCVIPVIPMTVAFFGHQAGEGGRSKAAVLALAYVGGITVLYSTIGMIAVVVGKQLSFLLQGPMLWLAMVVLFAAMGLSMFGLFEIPVPAFVAQRASARTGYTGAFTMGLVAGVLFMPCAGPVVGGLATGLAGFAQTAPAPVAIQVSLFAFAFYCLGLGSPFLVLALLSRSALSKAPKGGDWTVSVKKLFGMVFVGMSLYFMNNVPHQLLMATFVVGCAVYLAFFETKLGVKPVTKGLRLAGAAAILAIGVSLGAAGLAPKEKPVVANGSTSGNANEIAWRSYSDAALAEAKSKNKPVVMFFTADW